MTNPKPPISIVWLKRDLRLRDHAPLAVAVAAGYPVLICYVFEPSMTVLNDWDVRHWRFALQSLQDMQNLLAQRSLQLYWFCNEVLPVFDAIVAEYDVKGVYAHQETGNWQSFQRDLAVIRFFRKIKIPFVEFQQAGVIRRLKTLRDWDKKFEVTMATPQAQIERGRLQTPILSDFFYKNLQVTALPSAIFEKNERMQIGGETLAQALLQKFMANEAKGYMKNISKPDGSRRHCSRLSPHIAFGNLSIKQIYQATNAAMEKAQWKRDLENFRSRLFWQSHFVQKLEIRPRYQFESVNLDFEKVYADSENEAFLRAWEQGETGFPMVDACMKAVAATGWLNFRMRAMCVSFLTHHLAQPWQNGTPYLAKMFLDYEPGIHYAQFQMQAGVTGTNIIRTYNPVKQSQEHDVDAIFIKEWLPALRNVPPALLHEPWKLNAMEQVFYTCQIGIDYPAPIVPANQNKVIVDKLWALRKA